MGVDIYGRNPQVVGTKPELVNWEDASSEEREEYFESLENWENSNPGAYFRSNWWGWRPIHTIADLVIAKKSLPFNTDYWGSNDGMGLENQEQCNILADNIEEYLSLDKNLSDVFYLCLGAWCTSEGRFVSGQTEDSLNEQYPIGTVLYSTVVHSDGSIVQPAHSCSVSHIKNFIKFLRNCGGFEIW